VEDEVSPDLLPNAFGDAGAEDDASSPLVSLQLVGGVLELPALGIQLGQLASRGDLGIEQAGCQPVDLRGVVDPIFDDPNQVLRIL